MPESVFDRKARVRPPRVHITYEVEMGGALVLKELPFVMGVLSDLSGQPKEPLAKLKDRKFEDVESDLERGWEATKANSRLAWSEAKGAVRDGWHHIERAMPGDADRDGR